MANFERIPQNILRAPIPKAFAFDETPAFISKLAYAYSEATGYDHSGLMVAATVAAASVIDDRVKLEVQAGSNWYVSARLWAFLCAPSSGGKSPAIKAATDAVKDRHKELFLQWVSKNEKLPKDQQMPFVGIFTSDSTVAALSETLKYNPAGILMLTEEFSSWIGAIDSANQGEAAKNRGDWLQLRDGGGRQIDRIGRGSFYVTNWGASVLAACTPDGLQKQMRNTPEDGLIQRFIPCFMQPAVIKQKNGDYRAELKQWESKLRSLHMQTATCPHPTFSFSPQARELFEKECFAIRQKVQALEDLYPSYASHLGKYLGMLAEVALVFHYFEYEDRIAPYVSEHTTVQTAIRFMHRVEKHAYYLYSAVLSSSPAFQVAQSLARSLAADENKPETVGRDWMTQHCTAFKKADDRIRRDAVEMLGDMDWLEEVPWGKSYNGWPTKFNVNPKIFDIYAHEGQKWRDRRNTVHALITDIAEG